MSSEPVHPDPDPDRAALREGIALFNRREFHEAHEVLESAWRGMTGEDREIYQGLIQLAMGIHHALRGKWRASRLLLERALGRLAPRAGNRGPLPLADVVPAAEAFLERVARSERGEAEFDADRVPTLPEG